MQFNEEKQKGANILLSSEVKGRLVKYHQQLVY
jgi:hypothetical protein